MDPLDCLGRDIFQHILSQLAPHDLVACLAVCRSWARAADDDRLWRRLCEVCGRHRPTPRAGTSASCAFRLLIVCLILPAQAAWKHKVYVPAAGVQSASQPWRQRYAATLADAERKLLTAEELCTFRWLFKFKPEAGVWWMAMGEWLPVLQLHPGAACLFRTTAPPCTGPVPAARSTGVWCMAVAEWLPALPVWPSPLMQLGTSPAVTQQQRHAA